MCFFEGFKFRSDPSKPYQIYFLYNDSFFISDFFNILYFNSFDFEFKAIFYKDYKTLLEFSDFYFLLGKKVISYFYSSTFSFNSFLDKRVVALESLNYVVRYNSSSFNSFVSFVINTLNKFKESL